MRHDFAVVEAKPWHCGQMARALRIAQRDAVLKLGASSHAELSARFHQSLWRKVWLIDGKTAGLGGLVGTSISPEATIWLALSEAAIRYPVAMLKEAKRQLAEIMATRVRLTTLVLNDDPASRRFALRLGFRAVAAASEAAELMQLGG